MRMCDINKNVPLKKARLDAGLINEVHYEPIIKECFEGFGDLKHTEGNNDYFDWECESAIWELKTRFKKSTDFKDTIIGYDKVCYGLDQIKKGKQVFLLFAFTDKGLFYWELLPEKLTALKVDINGCHIRKDRKEYLHIPVDDLEHLDDTLPIMNQKYTDLKSKYDLGRKVFKGITCM